MRVVVVYNPASGSAMSESKLTDTFTKQGYEITQFVPVGDNFAKHLKKSINKKSIVAVVGGDGTIGSSIKPIIKSGATLLPLPGGTLNHFTKDLGINQDVSKALAHAATSNIHNIDVASINGHYFVNNSSLGIYPISLALRSRFERKLGKWPAALIGATRSLVRFHHYDLKIDGRAIITPFVFVGNNHYDFSALKIGNRRKLDQGILTVAVATANTRFELFKTFLLVLVRKLDIDTKFDIYSVSDNLKIKSRRHSIHVSADGEVYKFKPPLTYKIHKKSLKILD